MNSLGLIFSILLVVGMFILLRRIERWLHQHIFKVGWLLTRNFQTTTILYYTFFLPGVFLHELTYWLGAGIFNVRATVSIPFFKKEVPPPKDDKQAKTTTVEVPKPPPSNTIDISKLKPNFVTLDFGTARGRGKQAQKGVYRKAIISVLPLLVALVVIWLIADNIFNLMGVVATMASGELPDIVAAFNMLIGTPNFWLWIYIVFTIANTMFPFVPEELRGWRTVLITTVAVALALTLIGIGGEIFEAMQSPLANLIGVMEVTLILIIIVDILMVLVLGTIEYVIEHVTGNTATFRGSTMEVMTRAEAASFREREQERLRRREERFERQRNKAADSGLSSVYMLQFPIPGAPGEEPITQVVEAKPVAAPVVKDKPQPVAPPPLEVPAASVPTREKPEDIAARIHIPERKPLVPRQPEPETEDGEVQPAATLADPIAPFPRITASPVKFEDSDESTAETVEEQPVASPFARQLVSPITADEVEADELDTDDEIDEAPVKPIATFRSTPLSPSPVVKPDDEDSEIDGESDEQAQAKPSVPVRPRLGVTPFRSPLPSVQDDRADDEADEDVSAKPAASLGSRFGVTPFSSPASPLENDSEDKEADDELEAKPTARLGSRFGVTPFKSPVPSVEDDDSEDEEADEEPEAKPAASLGSRFGVTPFRSPTPSVQDNSEDDEADDKVEAKPAAALSSSFGVTPFKSPVPSVEDDDSEEAEADDEPEAKPAASSSSRFGVTPFRSPVPSVADDSEDDEADEDVSAKPAASLGSRFGVTPFRSPTPSVADDREDDEADESAESEKLPAIDLTPAKPKGILTRPTVDDSDDESDEKVNTKPVAPLSSRFGVSPFKGTPAPTEDEAEEETEDTNPPLENLAPAKPKGLILPSDKDNKPPLRSSTSRLGTMPFGRRVEAEDDEDETDEEESFLRRGRGDDAVSSLFSGLNTTRTDDDEDDEEEDTRSRFGGVRSTPSRFGSRPSVIGRKVTDDDDVEYADDDEYYDYDADDVDEYADDDDTDYVADDD